VNDCRVVKLAEKVLNTASLKKKYIAKPVQTDWQPDITISRQPGTGGAIVAKKVAEKLGWVFYDKKLITKIAQEIGISESLLKKIDGKPRKALHDFMHSLLNPNYISDIKYIKTLRRIITRIGKNGDVVIVGRGACCIIPHNKALHVRITLPEADRINNMIKYRHLSRIEAVEFLNKITKRRKRFLKQYFGKDIDDPSQYDTIINLKDISINKATNLVIDAFKNKFPRKKLNIK